MATTFIYLLCFLFLMIPFVLNARFAARLGVETHRGEEADRDRRYWVLGNRCSAAAVFLAGLWWFFFRRNPEPIAASHIVLVLPLGLHCVAVWLWTTRFAFSAQSLGSAAQEEGGAPAESALNRLLGEGDAKTTNYVKPTALPWAWPLSLVYFMSGQMAVCAGMFGRDLEESPFSLGLYLGAALYGTFGFLDTSPYKKRGFAWTISFFLAFGGVAAGLTYLLWPVVATS
jgi:hypothetical protein